MNNLISVCAWCDSIKTSRGWVKKSKGIRVLNIDAGIAHGDLTHSICSKCVAKWTKIDLQQFERTCQKETFRVA